MKGTIVVIVLIIGALTGIYYNIPRKIVEVWRLYSRILRRRRKFKTYKIVLREEFHGILKDEKASGEVLRVVVMLIAIPALIIWLVDMIIHKEYLLFVVINIIGIIACLSILISNLFFLSKVMLEADDKAIKAERKKRAADKKAAAAEEAKKAAVAEAAKKVKATSPARTGGISASLTKARSTASAKTVPVAPANAGADVARKTSTPTGTAPSATSRTAGSTAPRRLKMSSLLQHNPKT